MATPATINDEGVLLALRSHSSPTAWAPIASYAPAHDVDAHQRNRALALLSIHQSSHTPIPTPPLPHDEALVAYLLDQETLAHQASEGSRTSLSLAAFLIARFRKPGYLWAIWIARNSNGDTTYSVDTHFAWYAAGGIEGAKRYIQASTIQDVVGEAVEGNARLVWWKWNVEEAAGDEEAALAKVKREVYERVLLNEEHALTDAKINHFVEESWRTDTIRWAESVLPEEY